MNFELDNELTLDQDQWMDTISVVDWDRTLSNIDNNSLNFIYLNIRSIKKYFDDFIIGVGDILPKLKFVVLAEVNLMKCDYALCKNLYQIQDFESVSYLRENRLGGGLVAYIHNSCEFDMLPVNFVHCEAIFLKLICFKEVFILCLYRPPDSNVRLFLTELEVFLSLYSGKNFIITGDINIDISVRSDMALSYESLLTANGFFRKIYGYTREEIRSDILTKSCIDHIFIRGLSNDTKAAILGTKTSDHYVIAGTLSGFENTAPDTSVVYNRINKDNLKMLLRIFLEQEAPDTYCNVLDLYNSMCNYYKQARDASIVEMRKSKRKKFPLKPWMTSDIVVAIVERDRLFKIWKKSSDNFRNKCELKRNYTVARNMVNFRIKVAKRNYYTTHFENLTGNMKGTWKLIGEVMGRCTNKYNAERIINDMKLSEKEIANKFSKSFDLLIKETVHDCGTYLFEDYMRMNHKKFKNNELQSIYLPDTCEEKLDKIIRDFDKKKSHGCDDVAPDVVIDLIDVFLPRLVKLIDLSLKESSIPTKLKTALVHPVYKSGARNNYENYRPISVLPFISKIMEKYISNAIQDYLYRFGILDAAQYGYQKNKGTIGLLEKVTNFINGKLNENKHILCLFIDFSKAFDSINHAKLIEILQDVGIRGSLLDWFKDYLHNRKYCVKIGESLSDENCISRGVPQGSILGPLLYLIYVNDVRFCFDECTYYLYADDTLILSVHRDLNVAVGTLRRELYAFQLWAHDKELSINSKKTKILYVSSTHSRSTCGINIILHKNDCLHKNYKTLSVECDCNAVIEVVGVHRYLGLIFDDRFLWDHHIEDIRKRMRYFAGCFYYLKDIIPKNTLLIIYRSLVESIMSYGITVWGSASECYLDKLTSTQNRIVRNLDPGNNVENIYKTLGILEVKKLFILRLLLNNYFNRSLLSPVAHPYSTRAVDAAQFEIPRTNNRYGDRQLVVLLPRILNLLPRSLVELRTLREIKTDITKWLLSSSLIV